MNIKIDESCVVYEDNAVTTKIVNNVWAIKRTKHIDVKHHVIRYWHNKNVIDFAYTNTDGQLADIMPKCLSYPIFTRHRLQCMSNIEVLDKRGPFTIE